MTELAAGSPPIQDTLESFTAALKEMVAFLQRMNLQPTQLSEAELLFFGEHLPEICTACFELLSIFNKTVLLLHRHGWASMNRGSVPAAVQGDN